MKTILLSAVLSFLIYHSSIAQQKAAEAYWIVETNKKTELYSIVRVYDVFHQLIFEKRMEGVVIDINRERHKRILNRIVDHYYDESNFHIPEKLLKFNKSVRRSHWPVTTLSDKIDKTWEEQSELVDRHRSIENNQKGGVSFDLCCGCKTGFLPEVI